MDCLLCVPHYHMRRPLCVSVGGLLLVPYENAILGSLQISLYSHLSAYMYMILSSIVTSFLKFYWLPLKSKVLVWSQIMALEFSLLG